MSAVGTRVWAAFRPQRGILEYAGLISLVVIFVVLSIASSAFLSKDNLLNVLQANADIGIAACAGTLVIVAGGIDLSIGAIYALAGVISAKLAISSGVGTGILVGLAAGAAVGLLNGLVVTAGGVNPLIATLASSIIIGGGAEVVAGQELLTPEAASFVDLGRNSLLGVKYSIWLFVIAAIVFGVLLSRGRFGREVKVVGANQEAARLSGISVTRVRCGTYILSGIAAAAAGVITVSSGGQAQSSIGGIPFVLSVVAAIAVGGISLRGGEGAVWRTVVGVLFLGLVTNGLGLLNVNPIYDDLFTGLIILAAVTSEVLARRVGGGEGPRRSMPAANESGRMENESDLISSG
jgi:ribose transport system permease protein